MSYFFLPCDLKRKKSWAGYGEPDIQSTRLQVYRIFSLIANLISILTFNSPRLSLFSLNQSISGKQLEIIRDFSGIIPRGV
jgi:hypothetical protein